MSTLPTSAKAVIIGAGIVGNSMAYHLARLGWRDIVQVDKGPLPNPGGSTGHASNFLFPVDHTKEMTELTHESMRQYKEMGVLTECGGIEVARTPARMQELQRRMSSAKSFDIDDTRILTPDQVKELVPYIDETVILGGFYTPSVVRRRLAARRHDHARAGHGDGRPHGLAQHRGPRHRGRRRARRGRGDGPGTHRGGLRRHRLRLLEPEDGPHGGREHPADPRGAPDEGHRPRPPVRRREGRHRVPDRPRHGHQHVRAAARHGPRGRLLRPPSHPARGRGHPLERGSRPVPHRDAVHAGRLRPAGRALARAHAGDHRRRERAAEVRHQRPALAHAGRHAHPRRDAGGQGPVVRRRGVDQGGPRHRQVRRRVDGPRRVRDRPARLRHRPLPRPPQDPRAHRRAHLGGLQQDLRDRPPDGAVGEQPQRAPVALLRAGEGPRRRLLRDRRLGAPVLVRVERTAASRSSATP